MEFNILGPLEVRADGRTLALGGPRQRALLAVLLLNANRAVRFDVLMEEVWGSSPPRHARASLQNRMSALRRVLGPDRVYTEGAAYRLHVERGELDLHRFEDLVEQARAAEAPTRAALLDDALSLWRGLPLVEFPAEPFAQGEIARLEELRLSILEERIDAELASGHAEKLVPELEQLVASHPLRERLWAFLMLALYGSGRQAEALATYRRAHEALVHELGIEPGRELKDLQRRILLQDPRPQAKDRDLLREAVALLPTHDRARARALLDYVVALRRLGQNEQAIAALTEAERMAASLGDVALTERARLERSEIEFYVNAAPISPHLQVAERAEAAARAAGDRGLLTSALRARGRILRDLGQCAEATLVLEEAVDTALAAGDQWQEGMSRNFLATALLYGPAPVPEAIEACELHLAALEWGPPGPIGLLSSLGVLLAEAGRLDEGRRHLIDVIEGCRESRVTSVFAMHNLAGSSVAGDAATGVELLRDTYEIVDSVGDRGALAYAAAELAYALAPFEPDEADRFARAAHWLAADDDISAHVGWRRALGRLAPAGAGRRRLLEEAVALCAETDNLLFRAETYEDLAAAHGAVGDRDAERAALGAALGLYEAKGSLAGAERVRARA